MLALQQICNLPRVYPASRPKSDGTGSSLPTTLYRQAAQRINEVVALRLSTNNKCILVHLIMHVGKAKWNVTAVTVIPGVRLPR